MNLLNTSERRTRVKKPISLIVISFILIVSPIYNYYLQLLLRKLPISWSNILSLRFTKMELLFILLPVVCGVGLFLIKKWAWYLFLIYSSILILFNIIVTIVNPIRFNFYSLFESTLIFLGVVYFLKKDISAPYFKMYPRGWRGEKRKPVQIQIRINSEDRLTKDISEAGFYVDWKDAPFGINQEVTVEMVRLRSPTKPVESTVGEPVESIETDSDKRLFAAGVVRKEDNGVGFAFRRLSEEDSRWILNRVTVASDSWFAKYKLFATFLLIMAVLLKVTQCGVIKGKTKGEAPWLMLVSGINDDTASVGDGGHTPYGGNGASNGGGSNSSLVPPTGMYFFHPDHLGNIMMVTDGRGNVVSDNTGKSHISYKPYGEIHRTDSSGPDVSKFKFNGQEEDTESGLLYYKARYYDPVIGRFLQADSMVFPKRIMGMNRYMYVEGNPIKYRDPSGNNKTKDFFNSLGENMMGGAAWASGGLARAGDAYNTFTGNRKYQGKNDFRRSDIGGVHGGKAWDSIIGKDGLFGWFEKPAKYFTHVKNSMNGDTYRASNEGKINYAAEMYLKGCFLFSPQGSQLKEDCYLAMSFMEGYNDYHNKNSKSFDLFKNSRTPRIKTENVLICAILLQQAEEWAKIRRDPADPNPTNTSNGEAYDPPNRLNGCMLTAGD